MGRIRLVRFRLGRIGPDGTGVKAHAGECLTPGVEVLRLGNLGQIGLGCRDRLGRFGDGVGVDGIHRRGRFGNLGNVRLCLAIVGPKRRSGGFSPPGRRQMQARHDFGAVLRRFVKRCRRFGRDQLAGFQNQRHRFDLRQRHRLNRCQRRFQRARGILRRHGGQAAGQGVQRLVGNDRRGRLVLGDQAPDRGEDVAHIFRPVGRGGLAHHFVLHDAPPVFGAMLLADCAQHAIQAFALPAGIGCVLHRVVIGRWVIGRNSQFQVFYRQQTHSGQ